MYKTNHIKRQSSRLHDLKMYMFKKRDLRNSDIKICKVWSEMLKQRSLLSFPILKTLTQGLENLMSSNLVAPILNPGTLREIRGLVGFTENWEINSKTRIFNCLRLTNWSAVSLCGACGKKGTPGKLSYVIQNLRCSPHRAS